MATTVELSTTIDADVETVIRHVKTPRLLDHVTAPLIKFGYPESFAHDEEWPLGENRVTMRFMGLIPLGWQVIGIEMPESPDADTTLLFTKPATVPGATELGAGQVVEFLVGFSNKGDKDFVIETLDASFR